MSVMVLVGSTLPSESKVCRKVGTGLQSAQVYGAMFNQLNAGCACRMAQLRILQCDYPVPYDMDLVSVSRLRCVLLFGVFVYHGIKQKHGDP
jgi:hypothetical protein